MPEGGPKFTKIHIGERVKLREDVSEVVRQAILEEGGDPNGTFEVVEQGSEGVIYIDVDGERLPFGVGHFEVIRN